MSTDESENEMTEQMYTRADMARAWQEGAQTAWARTCEGWNSETAGEYSETAGEYGPSWKVPFLPANDDIPNPYE